MKKIKIAILGASEIAIRRFMPALKNLEQFEFYGVAVADKSEKELFSNEEVKENDIARSIRKAETFIDEYGGQLISSYSEVLENDEIDAVYIPLPPALHYYWAKKALISCKHVFLEKPFTISLEDTNDLIKIADEKNLAVFENYGFEFHEQINIIQKLIYEEKIGELRQIRTAFGFPFRGVNDFRYSRELGGGALFDCGGYPIKLSSILLGDSAKVTTASLSYGDKYDVDIHGSVTMIGKNDITSQISFGMDNYYKCELEIWGSKGVLYAPRIFTAPSNFSAEIFLSGEDSKVFNATKDDQFMKAIVQFYKSIVDNAIRKKYYMKIANQSQLINDVLHISLLKGDI